MPEKTVKRRLQDCDSALASDDGPIFSTVAKPVDALKRSIPEGTGKTRSKKRKPCALGVNYSGERSTRTCDLDARTAPRTAAPKSKMDPQCLRFPHVLIQTHPCSKIDFRG
jgi:hypothetical protein